MAEYQVFRLDFAGRIIGSPENYNRDSDFEARILGQTFQNAGGSVEIWRGDTIKVFPHTSMRSFFTEGVPDEALWLMGAPLGAWSSPPAPKPRERDV